MIYTDSEDAYRFATESGVDLMAVSVGTLHRMSIQSAKIQYDRLEAIQSKTDIPLVIHGATGIRADDLKRMIDTHIVKFNIGTALRIAFGRTLREQVNLYPEQYDRLKLFEEPMNAVRQEAILKYRQLGW
jgi:fructose-bisphosphate aldolase, class II